MVIFDFYHVFVTFLSKALNSCNINDKMHLLFVKSARRFVMTTNSYFDKFNLSKDLMSVLKGCAVAPFACYYFLSYFII